MSACYQYQLQSLTCNHNHKCTGLPSVIFSRNRFEILHTFQGTPSCFSDFHRSRYLLLMGHQNTCDRFHLHPRKHPHRVEFPSVVGQWLNSLATDQGMQTQASQHIITVSVNAGPTNPSPSIRCPLANTSFTTHRQHFWEGQTNKPITQCQVFACKHKLHNASLPFPVRPDQQTPPNVRCPLS